MEQHNPPFSMPSDHVSRRHQLFTCVHLLISHLTQSSCAFFVTLTTPALYRPGLRWFGGCFQKPPPEGLPPSQLQLRADRLCSRVTPVPPWQFSFTAKNRKTREQISEILGPVLLICVSPSIIGVRTTDKMYQMGVFFNLVKIQSSEFNNKTKCA